MYANAVCIPHSLETTARRKYVTDFRSIQAINEPIAEKGLIHNLFSIRNM